MSASRSGPTRFHFRQAGEALHPKRESLEVLEGLRRELGPITLQPNTSNLRSHPEEPWSGVSGFNTGMYSLN